MTEEREPPRPEPEALLAEACREGRGRLKIYLGMAPGVGKTFAMLEGARRLKAQGVDVVVGLVETHGRAETGSMIEGLDVLPRKAVTYGGHTLQEFDLDAGLARCPRVLLVDEYAHSNPPDSRHPKRWQDIEELLRAGVDVHTTLNVQHLESLNDVVARITGVRVRETVPDQVFEKAEDVELIDLTPEELLGRLREGRVYGGELAGRALENFFKPGNLSALRELALRRTADRVDQQLVGYMRAHAIEGPWAASERIMVCVGHDAHARSVVRAGHRLADQLGAPWVAVHIERSDAPPLDIRAQDLLEDALKLAEQMNARVDRLVGEDLPDELLRYARRNNITQILIGRSSENWWRHVLRRSLAGELVRRSDGISVQVIVPADSKERNKRFRLPSLALGWRSVAYALLSVGLTVGIGFGLYNIATPPNLAMLFLASVFIGSILYGVRAGLLTALLSFGAWNFFFTVPYYTLVVRSWSDIVMLLVFLLIATATGLLAGRVRDQARAAQARATTIQTLFDFSKRLSAAATPDALFHAIVLQAYRLASLPSVALLPGQNDLKICYAWPPEDELDASAMAAARWTMEHGEPAGHGTGTLPSAIWHFRPIRTGKKVVGVLGLRQDKADADLRQELLQTMDTILEQSAVAIERLSLAEDAARIEAMTVTDKLRTALMSSVSHDLRTPLTTILGSATTLRQDGTKLNPGAREELLQAIVDEAKRLDQYVTNLLKMSRLEAGEIKPQLEWIDPADVLESAVSRVARKAGGLALDIRVGPGVPLLRADFILLETVLINLLDNAIMHGEGAEHVWASVRVVGHKLLFEVVDDGAGIPAAYIERLFDRFFRVERADSHPAGSGLGLSICKGFVEAMGGKISVSSPVAQGKGASFTLKFDIEDQPANTLAEMERE